MNESKTENKTRVGGIEDYDSLVCAINPLAEQFANVQTGAQGFIEGIQNEARRSTR